MKHILAILTALLLGPLTAAGAAPVTASEDFITHEVALPATGTVIHLRIHPSGGVTQIRNIEFKNTTNP